jgi:transposase-like protein
MPRKQWTCDLAVLQRLWAAGKTHIEIAAALGCAEKQVEQLRRRHALPRRPRKQAPVTVDPTPEQIAERAAECRARRPEVIERHARVEIRQYVRDDSRGTINAGDFVW